MNVPFRAQDAQPTSTFGLVHIAIILKGQRDRIQAPDVEPTPSRRVVIDGKPARGEDGLLLEFSDDPTAIEQREAAHRFRSDVLNEAPLALYTLGVPHPFRSWEAACEELRQDRDRELSAMQHHANRVLLLILTQLAWERRGSPAYAPNRDDLDEAALQLASLKGRKAF